MSKLNKREQWAAALKEDLREVLGLYDLQILEDDGLWMWQHPTKDIWVMNVAPFSTHVPWEDNRGAKKGVSNTFGKRK